MKLQEAIRELLAIIDRISTDAGYTQEQKEQLLRAMAPALTVIAREAVLLESIEDAVPEVFREWRNHAAEVIGNLDEDVENFIRRMRDEEEGGQA